MESTRKESMVTELRYYKMLFNNLFVRQATLILE